MTDRPTVQYHGFYAIRAAGGGPRRTPVVVRDYAGAATPTLLPALVIGGPAFGWGEDPRPNRLALARAVLVDALGPDAALCDECHGTRRVVYIEIEGEGRDVPWDDPAVDANEVDPIDVGECICEDGQRPLPVADLDADMIARLEAPWWISRREVLAWLVRQFSTPPRWLAPVMTEVRDPEGRL